MLPGDWSNIQRNKGPLRVAEEFADQLAQLCVLIARKLNSISQLVKSTIRFTCSCDTVLGMLCSLRAYSDDETEASNGSAEEIILVLEMHLWDTATRVAPLSEKVATVSAPFSFRAP
jgi:hypothetical protein